MNKLVAIIKAIINKIPKDKLKHLGAGFIVASLAYVAGLAVWALPLCALAGAAKETYDFAANKYATSKGLPVQHDVDFMDALYTAAPGVLISILGIVL